MAGNNTPRRGPGRPRTRDEDQKSEHGEDRFDLLSEQLSQQSAQMSQMMSAITGLANQVSACTSQITSLSNRMDAESARVSDQFQKMEAQFARTSVAPIGTPSPGVIPSSAPSVTSDTHNLMRVTPVSEKDLSRHDIKLFGRSVSSVPTAGPKLTSTEVDRYIRWSKDFRSHAIWQGVSEFVDMPAPRLLQEMEITLGKQTHTEHVKRVVASRCKQVTAMIWNAVSDLIPDLNTVVSAYYTTHQMPYDPGDELRISQTRTSLGSDASCIESTNTGQPPPPVNCIGVSVGDDPYLTMQYLEATYANDSAINVNTILNKFLNFRFDDGFSTTKVMSEFLSLRQRLKSFSGKYPTPAGEFLPPIVEWLVLLNAFPKSLQMEKLLLLNDKELTLDKIQQQLLNREEMNKRSNKGVSNHSLDKAYLLRDDASLSELIETGALDDAPDDLVLALVRKGKFRRPPVPRNYQRFFDKHTNNYRSYSSDGHSSHDKKDDQCSWCLLNDDQLEFLQGDSDADMSSSRDDAESAEKGSGVSDDEPVFALPSPDTQELSRCILDSGTTRHVWMNGAVVKDQERISPAIKMTSASGHKMLVNSVGVVQLAPNAELKGVAVCPSAPANLVSTYRIVSAGFGIWMDDTGADIVDKRNDNVVLRFDMQNGMYVHKIRSGYKEYRKDGLVIGKNRAKDVVRKGHAGSNDHDADAPPIVRKKIPRKPSQPMPADDTRNRLSPSSSSSSDSRTQPGKGKTSQPQRVSSSSNALIEQKENDADAESPVDDDDSLVISGREGESYLVLASRRHR